MEENEYREEDVNGKLEHLQVWPRHLELLLRVMVGTDERQTARAGNLY